MAKIYLKCFIKSTRFAFLRVFEPDNYGGKDRYSVTLLIPKDSPELKNIKDTFNMAVSQAANILDGANVDISSILKDGDEKAGVAGYDGFEGNYYLKATCEPQYGKPEVFRKNTSGMGGSVIVVTDPNEIHSGDYGMATIQIHPYNTAGKGVTCILKGICKTEDGERLSDGGGSGSEADFSAALEDDGDMPDFL